MSVPVGPRFLEAAADWAKKAPADFAERVAKTCELAIVRARRERMTTHTGVSVSRYYGDEARA